MFNPQNLNRYSYVRNNPIRYTDPSGHAICMDDGYCGKPSDTAYKNKIIKDIQKDYGITFSGKWSIDNKMKVATAAILAGGKFADASGTTSGSEAFRAVYGLNDGDTFRFEWVGREQGPCRINGETCWGYTPGSNHIQIYETYNGVWAGNPYVADTPVSVGLVLHEMGHAFNQRLGGVPLTGLTGVLLTRPYEDHGFFTGHYVGQFSHDISPSEIFADMFVGWTFGGWGDNRLGDARRDYMEDMNTWVLRASQIP
jgi:hypothetical protein